MRMSTKYIFTLLFSGQLVNGFSQAKEPFAYGDFTWLNGVSRQKESLLKGKNFTGLAYFDTYLNYSFNKPSDHVVASSTAVGRHNEIVANHLSFGLSSNYKNIIARFYYQTGQMLTQINETSPITGQGRNTLIGEMKNIREAVAGYHFDKWNGINVEMGILPSPLGQESFLTGENWYYQHAFVADFTPYYFSGIRCQIYPTDKFEIDYQLTNGWQTYSKFHAGYGQIISFNYRPKEWLTLDADFYLGQNEASSKTWRFHHDHSVQVRYYNRPNSKRMSKAAFTMNNHYGSEEKRATIPELTSSPYFMGFNAANRVWFNKDKVAITTRGGYMTNPGRYTTPAPATAYFPASKGGIWDLFSAWDAAVCIDWMPNDFITFRAEWCSRFASVPFYAGKGGTTVPDGWTGVPGSFVPDLKKEEHRILIAANFRL